MRVVVLLFRFYTFYSFCIVLTENVFYFSNHTKNYDVDNVFFLISWDWSNTCYNAKVTTIQLCDPSALLSHLQRLRHKRQKETFSTVTFFFFFGLCNMYSVQKWDEMAPGNRRSQSLACWDIASDCKCVMRRSFMRQISKEMSKHQEIVSK